MSDLFDVLVIGGGPAGLTSALTLARQLHSVAIFDSGIYRNDLAKYQHLVLTWDHTEPSAYRSAARKNMLEQYDTVKIYETAIKTVKQLENGNFEAIDDTGGVWNGRKLILASGVEDIMPKIDGFQDCWGSGIYHCFFCKGYEDRGAKSSGIIAIDALASVPHAMHAGRHALQLSESVTFYCNGSAELAEKFRNALTKTPQMTVESRRIRRLVKGSDGGQVIVQLDDGTEKVEAFLGAVPKVKQRGPFASQLSLDVNPGGEINTKPPFMQSSMKGVFAAGDCGAPMKIAANALSTGAAVGAGVSGQVLAEKLGHEPLF